MDDIYVARGNEVYVLQNDGTEELFLTVHLTTASMTPEQQAVVIAGMCNDL